MSASRLLAAAPVIVLALALTLRAQNPAQPAKPKPPPGTKVTDAELVEKVIAARRDYQGALENLRAHYINDGEIEKAKWAEEELLQFHRMSKRPYRLDMDVPPPTLKPQYNIKEANELYRQAMTYKDKGYGTEYLDNQRRAELLLQRLLTNHPQSDKIDDAAYQLGDLYESKAYKHYDRAAVYFERCFQWNPKTQFDARIRAARLYERLNERNKAVEIYKEIVDRETDPKRLEEARTKLAELSGKK
jgi:tetratricopeptide (TPR) repeat protein